MGMAILGGAGWLCRGVGEADARVSRIGAARIARDTGLSAAFRQVGRIRILPHLPKPCGQTGLTRSRADGNPIRATFAPFGL